MILSRILEEMVHVFDMITIVGPEGKSPGGVHYCNPECKGGRYCIYELSPDISSHSTCKLYNLSKNNGSVGRQ